MRSRSRARRAGPAKCRRISGNQRLLFDLRSESAFVVSRFFETSGANWTKLSTNNGHTRVELRLVLLPHNSFMIEFELKLLMHAYFFLTLSHLLRELA
jgi:hypothetical protein